MAGKPRASIIKVSRYIFLGGNPRRFLESIHRESLSLRRRKNTISSFVSNELFLLFIVCRERSSISLIFSRWILRHLITST